MGKVFFISGIDTDSGKTVTTGLLAKYLLSLDKKVITQKLVQTGCSGIAEDILTHRKIMGIEIMPEDKCMQTCPFVFRHPSSPELAASMEGKEINLEVIRKNTDLFINKYDYILIEGAGGLMVPVTKEKMIIDYIRENKYELILVSGSKLGSINHTLLSLEVCKKYSINIKVVIYNQYQQTDLQIMNNSRQVIQNYLKVYFPKVPLVDIPDIYKSAIPEIVFECIAFDS